MKDWFKKNLHELRIFIWYIFTEPAREVRALFNVMRRKLKWTYGLVFVFVLALIKDNKFVAGLLILVLLIAVLMWEWSSGEYKYRWRQHYNRKIKKKLRETEGDKL